MSRYTLSVMAERSVAAAACEDGEGEAGGVGGKAAWEGMLVAISGIAIVKVTRDDLLLMALYRSSALECSVGLVLWVSALVC